MSRTANSSGQGFELGVQAVIERATGWPVMTHGDWKRAGSPRPAITTNAPYRNIYGSNRARSEFVIHPASDTHDTRIECKWQSAPGSVDEKFPYVWENTRLYPEPFVILMIGGSGARLEAVDWLKKQAAAYSHKSVSVMTNTDQLAEWLQRDCEWC